jgi:hypothetical protein
MDNFTESEKIMYKIIGAIEDSGFHFIYKAGFGQGSTLRGHGVVYGVAACEMDVEVWMPCDGQPEGHGLVTTGFRTVNGDPHGLVKVERL